MARSKQTHKGKEIQVIKRELDLRDTQGLCKPVDLHPAYVGQFAPVYTFCLRTTRLNSYQYVNMCGFLWHVQNRPTKGKKFR